MIFILKPTLFTQRGKFKRERLGEGRLVTNRERTKRPDSTRYQTSCRGYHPDKARLRLLMSFGEKKVRWWVLDIPDREVGSTGAKYRVLVNRVDTSNPDRARASA